MLVNRLRFLDMTRISQGAPCWQLFSMAALCRFTVVLPTAKATDLAFVSSCRSGHKQGHFHTPTLLRPVSAHLQLAEHCIELSSGLLSLNHVNTLIEVGGKTEQCEDAPMDLREPLHPRLDSRGGLNGDANDT